MLFWIIKTKLKSAEHNATLGQPEHSCCLTKLMLFNLKLNQKLTIVV